MSGFLIYPFLSELKSGLVKKMTINIDFGLEIKDGGSYPNVTNLFYTITETNQKIIYTPLLP